MLLRRQVVELLSNSPVLFPSLLFSGFTTSHRKVSLPAFLVTSKNSMNADEMEAELHHTRQNEIPYYHTVQTWAQGWAPQPVKPPILKFEQLTVQQKHILELVKLQLKKTPEKSLKTPLRLACYAAAGFGKSAIINHVRFMLSEHKKKTPDFSFIVAAFTGAAATLVDGSTIHSSFGIPLFNNYDERGNYILPHLSSRKKAELQACKFLILEEVSLIGQKLFGLIDKIMRSANPTYKDTAFAGRSVLIFGDIFQVTPVCEKFIFYPSNLLRTPCAASTHSYSTYLEFNQVFILNTPFRQHGESDEIKQFRAFLDRVRKYECTDADVRYIRKRQKCNLPADEVVTFTDALYAFPKRVQVETFNRETLRELFPSDRIVSFLNGAETLEIAVGAEVVLTKNLFIPFGLVNSACGKITDLLWTRHSETRLPILYCILVDFYAYKGDCLHYTSRGHGVPIFSIPDSVFSDATKKFENVTWFPLRLNYSRTIHRTQGMTLKRISFLLDRTEMAPGSDYVSFSRVSRVEEIMLLDDFIPLRRLVYPEGTSNVRVQLYEEKRLLSLQNLCHSTSMTTYIAGRSMSRT